MKTFKMLLPGLAILMMVNCVFAQTWTQTSAPINNWTGIACSADGTKLFAAANGDGIYISTNSGVTWTQTIATNDSWSCIDSAADGKKLLAATSQNNGGSIYISSDSGMTWTLADVFPSPWVSAASSSDGTKLAAVSFDSSALTYVSTNSGAIWASNVVATSNDNFEYSRSVACSSDGTRIVVASLVGTIFLSTNSGTTWAATSAPVTNWVSVASSASGTKLVAANGGGIYISDDAGTTWTPTSAPGNIWYSVASSADGSKLVAVAGGYEFAGNIYVSTNSGLTWDQADAPNTNWYSVAISADGSKFAAAVFGGSIYTFQVTPSLQLNFTTTNGGFKFSWIIPSTNFVMQQSSDLVSWTDVTNPPALNLTNLQDELVLSPTSSSGFFRLKTP